MLRTLPQGPFVSGARARPISCALQSALHWIGELFAQSPDDRPTGGSPFTISFDLLVILSAPQPLPQSTSATRLLLLVTGEGTASAAESDFYT
jgi:hypothetical protein